MRWIWKFLTSRNTGILLLIVVSLALLIGAALPNPDLMSSFDAFSLKEDFPLLYWFGDNFNSMKIGRSYIFGVVGILLVISTSFCSIERVLKKMRTAKAPLDDMIMEGKGISVESGDDPEEIRNRIFAILKKGRWRTGIFYSGEGSIITAGKGGIGFWGSIFFHAILITLIVAILLYYFAGLRATIVFTEGQEIKLSEDSFSRVEKVPVLGFRLPELRFKFKRFSAEYYDDYTATDYAADFDILDLKTGKKWNQVLRVNEPFRYRGIDFLMIRQGYSPNFVIYKDAVPVFDSYVALSPRGDAKDSFAAEKEGLSLSVEFFPDLVRLEDGGLYSQSPRPKNPHYGLEVVKEGEIIYRGIVGLGKDISFGSYRLVFNDLRYWITVNLVKETGLGFFFVSSMLGLAGVLVRGLDPDRKVIVNIKRTGGRNIVTLYHYSKHFEGMLKEEVTEMARQLEFTK